MTTQHPDSSSYSSAERELIDVLPFSGMSGYFANAPALRRAIACFEPDLMNAHYASGYGTTAALAGFRPTLLSVWGSDVYDFPYQSWWKGWLLRWNLRRATRLASTSRVMAEQTASLVPKLAPAFVTPFGVDCRRFSPGEGRDARHLTIGTVKTLAPKYGIDLLVRAFAYLLGDARLAEIDRQQPLRLLLVGGGPEGDALRALADELGVAARVEFAGQVPHDDVPHWLRRLDIYVAASRSDSESFGVAAVEASACGVPVVVSNAGGLPEVVDHGVTGLVVPRDDPQALARALSTLLLDPARRATFGAAGRSHVLQRYEWERCVDTMIAAYECVVAECKR